MASWLAAPAPMGSLEYVFHKTPERRVSFVCENSPRLMLDDIFNTIGGSDPNFKQGPGLATNAELGLDLA